MDWAHTIFYHGVLSLVIIDNLNINDITVRSSETDAPLIINTNTVLPGALAFKELKPIAGRTLQKRQAGCTVQLFQFTFRHVLKRTETFRWLPLK
jgi:hypothetical protein